MKRFITCVILLIALVISIHYDISINRSVKSLKGDVQTLKTEFNTVIPLNERRFAFVQAVTDTVMARTDSLLPKSKLPRDRIELQAFFSAFYDIVKVKYGYPVDTCLALVFHESGFYRFAVSDSFARGYWQVMLAEARRNAKEALGKTVYDLNDPYDNTGIGMYILYTNRQDYGSLLNAIAAYNGGPKWKGSMAWAKVVCADAKNWRF